MAQHMSVARTQSLTNEFHVNLTILFLAGAGAHGVGQRKGGEN